MTTIEMQVTRIDAGTSGIGLVSEEGHECSVGAYVVRQGEWYWGPKLGDSVMVELDSDEYPLRVWRDGVLVWGSPARTLEETIEETPDD